MNLDDFRAELRGALDTPIPADLDARVMSGVRGATRPTGRPRWLLASIVAVLVIVLGSVGLAAALLKLGGPTPGGITPSTGTSPSTPSPNTASPTPTSGAWQPTAFALLVFGTTVTSGGQYPKSVRFVRADGSTIRTVQLPDDARFPTVGGESVFYISAGHLFRVGIAGAASDLGALAGASSTNPGWGGLAISPDGNRWVWSYLDSPQGSSTASTMEMGGVAEPAHVVMHEANPQGTQYLEPVAWGKAGIVVIDQPGNIGGFPLFFDDIYWGRSMLVDPSSFTSKTLTDSQSCPLNDVAGDGSFTCVVKPAGPVKLTRPDGSQRALDLPVRGVGAGDAFVSADRTRLAVGVNMTENTGNAQNWDVRTYIADLGTSAWSRQGPAGSVPYGWLPDGSLVLEDEVSPAVTGGNSAHLLRPDATLVDLGQGRYLGALNPTESVACLATSG